MGGGGEMRVRIRTEGGKEAVRERKKNVVITGVVTKREKRD